MTQITQHNESEMRKIENVLGILMRICEYVKVNDRSKYFEVNKKEKLLI